MGVQALSFKDIDTRLRRFVRDERVIEADFLEHLAEFDRRRGYERLGYPSLWSYCTDELGLLACATWRRTRAAAIIQRFPIALRFLREEKLWMTTLVLLRDVLTDENVERVLDMASNKSVKAVEELVARLAPKPDVPQLLRVLPTRAGVAPGAGGPGWGGDGVGIGGQNDENIGRGASVGPGAGGVSLVDSERMAASEASPSDHVFAEVTSVFETQPRRVSVEVTPIADERYVLKATVTREFVEALHRASEILSHSIPGRDYAAVLERGLDRIIADHEKRTRPKEPKKAATEPTEKEAVAADPERKPAAEEEPVQTTRVASKRDQPVPTNRKGRPAIPMVVRREVWKEANYCCAWLMPGGGRCGAKWQLEIDHVIPVALGGETTVGNCRLMCRKHNSRAAREALGERVMEKYRRPLLRGTG